MTTERDTLTFAVIDAAMSFLEAVYQDALVLINFGGPSLYYKRRQTVHRCRRGTRPRRAAGRNRIRGDRMIVFQTYQLILEP